MRKIKQVIILRKFDFDVPIGKYASQACHASVGAYVNASLEHIKIWNSDGAAKIVLSVNSDEELIKIFNEAVKKNLPCSLIKDEGLTVFNNTETLTAVGIGPYLSSEIDKITGNLNLF